MKQTILSLFLLAAVAVILATQGGAQNREQRERGADTTSFEVRSVFPREVTPGIYQQVTSGELQILAGEGWELVSVTPYVYRNEERGQELQGPRAVVTQTYPAYFFKRIRTPLQRRP